MDDLGRSVKGPRPHAASVPPAEGTPNAAHTLNSAAAPAKWQGPVPTTEPQPAARHATSNLHLHLDVREKQKKNLRQQSPQRAPPPAPPVAQRGQAEQRQTAGPVATQPGSKNGGQKGQPEQRYPLGVLELFAGSASLSAAVKRRRGQACRNRPTRLQAQAASSTHAAGLGRARRDRKSSPALRGS